MKGLKTVVTHSDTEEQKHDGSKEGLQQAESGGTDDTEKDPELRDGFSVMRDGPETRSDRYVSSSSRISFSTYK